MRALAAYETSLVQTPGTSQLTSVRAPSLAAWPVPPCKGWGLPGVFPPSWVDYRWLHCPLAVVVTR